MTRLRYILAALAVVSLTSCIEEIEKDMPAEITGEEITLSAGMADDPQPETKVDYGGGAAGLKWKASGEKFTAFFSAASDAAKSTFEQISVSEDGKIAGFKGTVPDGATSLFAIYPPLSSGNPTSFTLDLTSQVGVYREDKTYMESHNLSTFSVSDKNAKVKFNHLTSIIKMTLDFGASVSGTASSITFCSPELIDKHVCSISKDGVKVTKATASGAVKLTSGFTIRSGKVTVYLYAFPSTINTISVTCRADNKDYTGFLTKTGGKKMEAGKQYNATISMTECMNLTFDFRTCPKYWPTYTQRVHSIGGMPYKYTLNGTDYKFILADAPNADDDRLYWNETHKSLFFAHNHRYLGLPVIKGYKLTCIKCLSGPATTENPRMGVTDMLYDSSVEYQDRKYVEGGEIQNMKEAGKIYRYDLPETSSGTMYYLSSARAVCIQELTLTYIPTDEVVKEPTSCQVRVGSYNVRNETMDTGNNAWSKRKTRLVQSIKDNDFDVFGVQECTYNAMTYLDSELSKSGYTSKFFNIHRSDGKPASNNESLGIYWKTSKFELVSSSWKFCWPRINGSGTMGQDDYKVQDDGSKYYYYRGLCCLVLKEKATGVRIFVMNMHGYLNDERRDQVAPVYITKEKEYNPNRYPSFFIGDMNTRPFTRPASDGSGTRVEEKSSTKFREYWTDPWLWLPKTAWEGNENSYNGWVEPKRRIDFVYYKGNVEPIKCVCNNALYGGYFASDHYPIYLDAKVWN